MLFIDESGLETDLILDGAWEAEMAGTTPSASTWGWLLCLLRGGTEDFQSSNSRARLADIKCFCVFQMQTGITRSELDVTPSFPHDPLRGQRSTPLQTSLNQTATRSPSTQHTVTYSHTTTMKPFKNKKYSRM